MNIEDYRRHVMCLADDGAAPFEGEEAAARRAVLWGDPALGVRERRLVTLVCAAAAVDVALTEAHVYAALKSGDFTVAQLNEATLHFAVYCGWPRASQLEACVRGQWKRLHEERGEVAPAFPTLTFDDLGITDPAARLADGIECFTEVNLIPAPGQDSPYFYVGILHFVFGHLWRRPGLTRRERRLLTIPSVGVSDAVGPIWSHVTSALQSGDVNDGEMGALVAHFTEYAGTARAEVLGRPLGQWQTQQS